jgi:4-aminobutyrate aminotransferase-like enzyme
MIALPFSPWHPFLKFSKKKFEKEISYREGNMKKSELIRLRQDNVPKGVSQAVPAMIAEAKGAWVRDVEGKEFLDFSGGIGVLNVPD